MRHFLVSMFEVLKVVLIAVGTVLLIRTFLVQPFLVSGQSMAPTFQNRDYLLVDELTYRFRLPERGEVIVFRSPSDRQTFFIKRVIGLPGERIQIKEGKVVVSDPSHPEGTILNETYLTPGLFGGASAIELASTQYFVMGDNRAFSLDSRSWGPLEFGDIIGLVRLRLWPLVELKAFAAPQYDSRSSM